jgi:hypothetical protein
LWSFCLKKKRKIATFCLFYGVIQLFILPHKLFLQNFCWFFFIIFNKRISWEFDWYNGIQHFINLLIIDSTKVINYSIIWFLSLSIVWHKVCTEGLGIYLNTRWMISRNKFGGIFFDWVKGCLIALRFFRNIEFKGLNF